MKTRPHPGHLRRTLPLAGAFLSPVLRNGWIANDQVVTFGRFLLGDKPKEKPTRRTTLFKSVGMALFDVCVSKLIYDSALKKGLGREIAL